MTMSILFTLFALGTLAFGALIGPMAWETLVEDIADRRNRCRRSNITTSILFIALSTAAIVTACHSLTHIWIR